MYSDQQLVTGIAILSAGYSQLSGGLPFFYWQFLLQLAWFSSITHLTALTLLRQYFLQNSAARWWRFILMLVLALMQTVALLPTIYEFIPSSVPTVCVLKFAARNINGSVISTEGALSLVMIVTYLVSSYVTRLIKLSRNTSAFIRKWIRLMPGNYMKCFLGLLHFRMQRSSAKVIWWSFHTTFLVIFVLLRAIFDIVESTFWEYMVLPYASDDTSDSRTCSSADGNILGSYGYSRHSPLAPRS